MKQASLRKRATAGFSLMELLVVISIIVILAGLTIGSMSYVNQAQARKQAEIQIALLQSALQDYQSEQGEFPLWAEPSGREGSLVIYRALYPVLAGDELELGKKVYLAQLDPNNDSQGWVGGGGGSGNALGGRKIIDPWATEYYYRTNNPEDASNGIAANPDFDLWSAGPDGKTEPGANGNYDSKHPYNLDDIRGW